MKKTGRKQLVLTGLWTSMCMAIISLHGLREGYEVYGVMDAAALESLESRAIAHQCLQRYG